MQKKISLSSRSNRRHRADFARQAVIAAFGRHARALDWDDFTDRQPGASAVPSPEARFK